MHFLKRLFLVVFVFALFAFAQSADNQKRTIRVGYYGYHNFIEKQPDGTFTGYGVEYLDSLAKMLNWEIEYVFASWSLELEMLERGELDIVPFAQYNKERAEKYNFSRLPMGVIQGLLSVRDDNTEIYYNEYKAMDGKTVGIVEGNHNIFFLKKFAVLHNFKLNPVKFRFHEDAARALLNGEIDLMASEQVIGHDSIRIVAHYGSDPAYFLLNKKDTSLLFEINEAMNEIYSKDGTFRAKLYKKYFNSTEMHSKPIFTREEKEYIEKSDSIEVMLIADSQPGSYKNDKGEYTGIVVDIMEMISDFTGLKFKYHFNTLKEAPLEHIKKHSHEIAAGVLSINPALKNGNFIVSDDFYEVYASLVKSARNTEEIDYKKKNYTIGIPPMFQAMNLYVQQHYPNLKVDNSRLSILDNLQALDRGEIDLFLYDLNMILHYWGNPRFKDIRIVTTSFINEPQCIVATDTPENKTLMKIINKAIAIIPEDKVKESERYHMSRNYYKPTYMDNLYRLRYPIISSIVFILIMFSLMVLYLKKQEKQKKLIEKTNRKLKKAVEYAEQASKVKSNFLSSMSHDIRTPMNAIMGMTTLVKQEVKNDSKIMDYLNKINSSSHVLLQLLNNILDSTALESGKMKVAHVPFDLSKEIESLKNMFEMQCAKKEINLVFDFKKVVHTRFIGDALRFNQIFLNLLSNAYKFTPEKGTISFKGEELICENNIAKLHFEVRDSGDGISNDLKERLFDPFEQKDATTAHKYGGSGLGLNIVKRLVELKGGTIDFASKEGEGTVFFVNFSLEVDSSDFKIEEEKEEDYDFTGKKVLVADDDDFNREVVAGLLNIVHIDCDCVEDGKQALETFEKSEENKYDAILMDVHMPVMDGYEASQAIRNSSHKRAKTIPILALTADAFPEDIKKAKSYGMTGHLSKPIYQDVLYKTLKKVFENPAGGAEFYKFYISRI